MHTLLEEEEGKCSFHYLCMGLYISLQLLVPVIANQSNQKKWPNVVSSDLLSHVGGLKGDVFKFTGQVKGRTLLPLPPQTNLVVEAVEEVEG